MVDTLVLTGAIVENGFTGGFSSSPPPKSVYPLLLDALVATGAVVEALLVTDIVVEAVFAGDGTPESSRPKSVYPLTDVINWILVVVEIEATGGGSPGPSP